jgi:hypothetical protein
MKTRSQTKSQAVPEIQYEYPSESPQTMTPLYDVDIDFDDASACWRANKKKLKNGCYAYICGSIMKNGKTCMKTNCRRHPNTLSDI